jgi:3-oxoacyl-[acyl-carrier protein] reductase
MMKLKELADQACRNIIDEGGICEACVGDVADPEFTKYMTALAVKKFGKLNIAVASAGITVFGDFLSYTPEQFNA